MASRSSIAQPNLPQPPEQTDGLLRWARELVLVLDSYFTGLSDQGADRRLIGRVDKQIVGPGFTIQPTLPFIDLLSVGNVVSDITVAVKAGNDGQWIILQNMGTFTITILNGALTSLRHPIVGDVVLQPLDTLALKWNGALWSSY